MTPISQGCSTVAQLHMNAHMLTTCRCMQRHAHLIITWLTKSNIVSKTAYIYVWSNNYERLKIRRPLMQHADHLTIFALHAKYCWPKISVVHWPWARSLSCPPNTPALIRRTQWIPAHTTHTMHMVYTSTKQNRCAWDST